MFWVDGFSLTCTTSNAASAYSSNLTCPPGVCMEGKQSLLHLHAPMLSPHSFSAPDMSNESHTARSIILQEMMSPVGVPNAGAFCYIVQPHSFAHSFVREFETWRSFSLVSSYLLRFFILILISTPLVAT
jgi:hypothetical protein